MSSVLDVKFTSTTVNNPVHPNAKVYAVAFRIFIDIDDIDKKNKLTEFVITNEGNHLRRLIAPMSKTSISGGIEYSTNILETCDIDDINNRLPIDNTVTYHTYVVIDSKETDELNKTSLHVFRV